MPHIAPDRVKALPRLRARHGATGAIAGVKTERNTFWKLGLKYYLFLARVLPAQRS